MTQRKPRQNLILLSLLLSMILIYIPLCLTSVTQEIAQPIQPPRPWVRDQAKVWSLAERDRLETALDDLNRKNTTEFVIISESKSYEMNQLCSRAKALKNDLRVGRPEFDNGILAFISKTGDSVSGCLSRGSGIPHVYYQYALFGQSNLDSIDRQIPELAKTSYESKPIFRSAYQWLGSLGFAIIATIILFDASRKDDFRGSILLSRNSHLLATRKICLLELSISLICISASTFILSKMPIGGGLHSWKYDFFLSGLASLPSLLLQGTAINLCDYLYKSLLSFSRINSPRNSSPILTSIESYKELRRSWFISSLIPGFSIMNILAWRLSFSDLYKGYHGTSYVFEASLFAFPILSSLGICISLWDQQWHQSSK